MAGPLLSILFQFFSLAIRKRTYFMCGEDRTRSLLSIPSSFFSNSSLSLSHCVYVIQLEAFGFSAKKSALSDEFPTFQSDAIVCHLFLFSFAWMSECVMTGTTHTHTHARFLYYNGTLYHLKIPPCSYPGDFIVYITRTEKRKRERERMDTYFIYSGPLRIVTIY